MTLTEQVLTIAACTIGTMLTRFLPFLVFSSKKPTPDYIQYLGRALPCAIFAMLVVYCLKDVTLLSGSHGLPEALGIAVTIPAAQGTPPDAALDCRRHHLLHGPRTDGIQIESGSQTEQSKKTASEETVFLHG